MTTITIIFLLVAGGLVFYALKSKGDVRAEISHGLTVFKLEVKEPTAVAMPQQAQILEGAIVKSEAAKLERGG
jgi:hypothetical protein